MTEEELGKLIKGMTDDSVGIAMCDLIAASLKSGAMTIHNADGGSMEDGGFILFLRLKKVDNSLTKKEMDDMINNAIASAS